jgi:hypothetical protein
MVQRLLKTASTICTFGATSYGFALLPFGKQQVFCVDRRTCARAIQGLMRQTLKVPVAGCVSREVAPEDGVVILTNVETPRLLPSITLNT